MLISTTRKKKIQQTTTQVCTPNEGGRKYDMEGKKDNKMYFQVITIIDPATDLIEIRSVPKARADLVANQVKLAWLTKYPLPYKIIKDKGKEL